MSCCERFEAQLRWSCDIHDDPFDCPDALVVRTQAGYGLPIHDGGSSYVEIHYCPWCGASLASA
jgi:hypothetical protein